MYYSYYLDVSDHLTGLYDVVQRREPLLDRRRYRPEDEDEREVHVAHEGATKHPRVLVKAVDETSDGMKKSERFGIRIEIKIYDHIDHDIPRDSKHLY